MFFHSNFGKIVQNESSYRLNGRKMVDLIDMPTIVKCHDFSSNPNGKYQTMIGKTSKTTSLEIMLSIAMFGFLDNKEMEMWIGIVDDKKKYTNRTAVQTSHNNSEYGL